MRKLILIPLLLLLVGCPTSLEKNAYRTIVGARALTQSISAKHPECGSRDANDRWVSLHSTVAVCQTIDKGITAKDLLIDAAEAYCAGGAFETGGACNHPTDQNVLAQLTAKLNAAISGYNQIQTDLTALK